MTATDTAQETCKPATPQQEHEWLGKLVGDWTFESECSMGPDTPPMKTKGTESVKSLGGLWVVAEGSGEVPGGGDCNMLMTLGYDPLKKTYLGTWVGSMMTHMFVYAGEMDSTGKILTLSTEGPSFTDPTKMTKYHDIIEIKSDNERMLRSRCLGEDGKWTDFMSATYKRKK